MSTPQRSRARLRRPHPWQRVRGSPFSQQFVGFGEAVLYRYTGKGPQHQPDGNTGALGAEGLFMGYNIYSNTFRIVGGSGQAASGSMTRMSNAERWNAEALARVRVAPGTSYVPVNRGQVRFADLATATAPTSENVKASSLRTLRINQSDLEEFGYYATCPQCTHVQRHGKP